MTEQGGLKSPLCFSMKKYIAILSFLLCLEIYCQSPVQLEQYQYDTLLRIETKLVEIEADLQNIGQGGSSGDSVHIYVLTGCVLMFWGSFLWFLFNQTKL